MLALDPFYEMFPTTRRRSYPWWRYSHGLGLDPVITQVALETSCPQLAPLATCKSLVTRPAGSIQNGTNDAETIGCCLFNAFKADDDALGRQLLTVLDVAATTALLTNLVENVPASAAFLARIQGPPGLSTKAKIAIGAGIVGVLGVGALLLARR